MLSTRKKPIEAVKSKLQLASIEFCKLFVTLGFALFSTLSFAQNKVVVIPMSGDDAKPLANIVTVAKANGDFSNPITAMASITNASATNPYLLVIAPGVYNLGSNTLMMKPYVEVAGSGMNATVLSGTASGTGTGLVSSSAQIVSAANSSIRDLSLQVNGTSNQTIGILNEELGFVVSNVKINVTGADGTNGITNSGTDSSLRIFDSIISVVGLAPNGVISTAAAGVTTIDGSDILSSNTGPGFFNAVSDSGSDGVRLLNSTINAVIQNAAVTDRIYCASTFSTVSSATGTLLESDCNLPNPPT